MDKCRYVNDSEDVHVHFTVQPFSESHGARPKGCHVTKTILALRITAVLCAHRSGGAVMVWQTVSWESVWQSVLPQV